jgi:uncharacterized protein (UPF0218 family)
MPRLLLTDELRAKLRLPLGTLLTGPPERTIRELKKIVEAERPLAILCVGDFVSKNVKDSGLRVDVSVVDYKIMRREAESVEVTSGTVFRASNPAGTIELAAWEALREAIEKKNSLVVIDGEEDLLTLPAIMLAPDGSIVVYGQPNEGMVIVRVNSQKKAEIKKIVDSMIAER